MLRAAVLLMFSMTWSHAELAPSVYEEMQKKASDELVIQVLRVSVAPGQDANEQELEVLARVDSVKRSDSGVREDDLIQIRYSVVERPKGWAGPGSIPLLKENQTTVAFLRYDPEKREYAPAAGRMSFSVF